MALERFYKRESISSLSSEVFDGNEKETGKESHNYLPQILTFTNSPKSPAFIGRFKIVVIGDEKCGKTSFINSFVHRTFDSELPRISVNDEVLSLRFGRKQLEFLIWDLSGCESYKGLRCEFYKDADLFLLCYDVGKSNAMKSVVDDWLIELTQETYNTPFMLVGCKQDLRQSLQTIPLASKEESEQVALDWAAKEHIECSAKTGYNILKVFMSVAQVLLTNTAMEDKTSINALKNLPIFQRKRMSKDFMEITYGDKAAEYLSGQSITMHTVSAF